MYCSPSHGKFILYIDSDVICANWEGSLPSDRKNVKLWKNGQFFDESLILIARASSDDVAAMAHWIKEEVLKFANAMIPIPEEEEQCQSKPTSAKSV